MKKRCVQFIGVVLMLGGLAAAAVESAFQAPLGVRGLNAWVASFHPWEAAYALKNYSQLLEELSIFGVGGTASGRLAVEKEFIRSVLAAANRQDERPRILLTVANNRRHRIGDRRLLRQWIGTSEGQRRHIHELMRWVDPVDGLDINYENLFPMDGPRFAVFITQLAQALHARGKYLSVTVERNALLYASIDWRDLSTRVDRIRVMAYPYHYARSRPGAVSPPGVVRLLAERALKYIPPEKLEIALPLYGFDWSPQGGKLVTTMRQYRQLTRKPGARVFRDARTQCARIQYDVKEGKRGKKRAIRHEVWFEDPQSVAYKVHMLRRMGVAHIGLWQLGVGNISQLFELIKESPAS
ncbi:MAG: hypothetical protein A2992_00475 [Elusimicrobia bacterium RIFCSPLOWO2_01_FULL_59_12]|nr:MAG: hypothetical protein A2992_00475 [Elusimicrobia bacterium RIFCSPLOWO2_01_FULL_59_12]